MTTLEAAEQYGYLTRQQAERICREHDVSFAEALNEIGDSVTDARALMVWLGY